MVPCNHKQLYFDNIVDVDFLPHYRNPVSFVSVRSMPQQIDFVEVIQYFILYYQTSCKSSVIPSSYLAEEHCTEPILSILKLSIHNHHLFNNLGMNILLYPQIDSLSMKICFYVKICIF